MWNTKGLSRRKCSSRGTKPLHRDSLSQSSVTHSCAAPTVSQAGSSIRRHLSLQFRCAYEATLNYAANQNSSSVRGRGLNLAPAVPQQVDKSTARSQWRCRQATFCRYTQTERWRIKYWFLNPCPPKLWDCVVYRKFYVNIYTTIRLPPMTYHILKPD